MRKIRATPEQLAAWELDQLDPDNWFVIPDFGTTPSGAGFDGFMNPVVGPGDKRYAVRQHVREMLTVARTLARNDFARLKDLHKHALAGYDALDSGAKVSRKQGVAIMYGAVTRGLEATLRQEDTDLMMEFLAGNAASLAQWAAGDLNAAMSASLSAIRAGAALGGARSAKTRQLQALDEKAVERAAQRLGWPATTKGVYKVVSQGFNATPERIGQILRKRLSAK